MDIDDIDDIQRLTVRFVPVTNPYLEVKLEGEVADIAFRIVVKDELARIICKLMAVNGTVDVETIRFSSEKFEERMEAAGKRLSDEELKTISDAIETDIIPSVKGFLEFVPELDEMMEVALRDIKKKTVPKARPVEGPMVKSGAVIEVE